MIDKIKQYKNLILVVAFVAVIIAVIVGDPLGYAAERAHNRASIRNRMAIEKAEAEKEIAIIKAQTDAKLKQIELSITVTPEEEQAFEELRDEKGFSDTEPQTESVE